jgi:hypothetical protein
MNRKTQLVVLGGVIALFVAAYFASPLLAVRGLISAAKAGDEARLEKFVDFPAFRTSLKAELNAKLVEQMRADLGDRGGGLSGLGMILAPTLISGAVDAFVTPQAVAAMVRSGEVPSARSVARNRARLPDEPSSEVHQSYSYRGLNTFAVRLTREDRPDDYVDLLLDRRNVFGWKLAAIDLPRKQ